MTDGTGNPPGPAGLVRSELWRLDEAHVAHGPRIDLLCHALLGSVCAYLRKNRRRFDPRATKNPGNHWRGTKALLELAVFCSVILNSSSGEYVSSHALMDAVLRVWRDGAFSEKLARMPDQFRMYGTMYAAIAAAGHRDPVSDRIFAGLLDDGYVLSAEETPHRQLELAYILGQFGRIQERDKLLADAIDRTLLVSRPRAERLTDADVYAITHAIFYVSEFGIGSARNTFDKFGQTAADRQSLDIILATRLLQRNWDIVAELLICRSALRLPHDGLWALAWQQLAEATTDECGAPGPWRSGSPNFKQHLSAGPSAIFRDNYHTSLAVGIAAAAYLQHEACHEPH